MGSFELFSHLSQKILVCIHHRPPFLVSFPISPCWMFFPVFFMNSTICNCFTFLAFFLNDLGAISELSSIYPSLPKRASSPCSQAGPEQDWVGIHMCAPHIPVYLTHTFAVHLDLWPLWVLVGLLFVLFNLIVFFVKCCIQNNIS